MPAFTHPKSKIAGDIFEYATSRMGVVEASAFMFTGNAALDGASPLQAIKADRLDDVRRVLFELETNR